MPLPEGLWQRVQREDPDALHELLLYAYNQLLPWSYRYLGRNLDGEQLAQQALLRVYRCWRQCHDPARFNGWLRKLTYRSWCTYRKRGRRHKHLCCDETRLRCYRDYRQRWELPPDPATAAAQRELQQLRRQALERALGTLSEKVCRMFVRYYWENCTSKQLMEELGVATPKRVYQRLWRYYAPLRRLLQEQESLLLENCNSTAQIDQAVRRG